MEGAHHRGEMEVYAEMAADDEEGLVLFAGVTLPLRWAVGSICLVVTDPCLNFISSIEAIISSERANT